MRYSRTSNRVPPNKMILFILGEGGNFVTGPSPLTLLYLVEWSGAMDVRKGDPYERVKSFMDKLVDGGLVRLEDGVYLINDEVFHKEKSKYSSFKMW